MSTLTPSRSLLALTALSLLAGAASGLVAATFRLALLHVDRFCDGLVVWAHTQMLGFLLVITACLAAAAVAAALVRRYSPHASGSGIPHVEAVLSGALPQAPYRLILVKFWRSARYWLRAGAGTRRPERPDRRHRLESSRGDVPLQRG